MYDYQKPAEKGADTQLFTGFTGFSCLFFSKRCPWFCNNGSAFNVMLLQTSWDNSVLPKYLDEHVTTIHTLLESNDIGL